MEHKKIYLAGLDIGGTKSAVISGVISPIGDNIELLERIEIPTDTGIPATAMLEILSPILSKMINKYPISTIGISCGGPLDSEKGIIMSPPNLPGWDNVKIVDYFQKLFTIPVALQNDANACALAEWKFGAGKGSRNMIFCTMGTGFGAGLILNGQLYSGTSDLAGEIGHVRLSDQGPVGFSKRGSVEGFCSGGGIAQLGKIAAMEQLQAGKTTSYCKSFSELDGVSAKSIAMAAIEGDETAIEVYRECGAHLGKALSIMIDLLNPDLIVLGSIFERSEQLLRKEMDAVIRKECIPSAASACRIVAAKLGDSIGNIAALSIAFNKFITL